MTSAAVRDLFRSILRTPIAAQRKGKVHNISLLRAIILKQAQRAAAGDTRAARFMLECADRYLADPSRRNSGRSRATEAPACTTRSTCRRIR